MSKVTKKELHAQCDTLGLKYTRKNTIAQLQALIAEAQPQPRKRRVSTKQVLRDMFTEVGDSHSIEDVIAHVTSVTNVKEATIGTMLGDLRNSKYAAGPTIDIVKQGEEYVRIS